MPRAKPPARGTGSVDPGEDEQLWAAVGDPSRRRLLDLLVAGGETTSSRLAQEVPFSRQAVSKHLAVLERANLVASRREGREVHYAVNPARLAAAAEAMTRAAARWDQRLLAIKQIAEDMHRGASDRAEPGH